MSKQPPESEPLVFAPRPNEFAKRVNQLARDTRNVKWSAHARERMLERDIPIRIALDVLRGGTVSGAIEAGLTAGEWKAKVVMSVKGRRDVGVAVLLVKETKIFVKTVEWEDIR